MTTKHLIVLIGPSGEKVKRKVDSTSRLSALLAAFLSETKRPSDQTAWELYLAEDEECAEELELGATLKEEELDVKVRLRVVEKGAKRPRPKPAAPAVAVAESVKGPSPPALHPFFDNVAAAPAKSSLSVSVKASAPAPLAESGSEDLFGDDFDPEALAAVDLGPPSAPSVEKAKTNPVKEKILASVAEGSPASRGRGRQSSSRPSPVASTSKLTLLTSGSLSNQPASPSRSTSARSRLPPSPILRHSSLTKLAPRSASVEPVPASSSFTRALSSGTPADSVKRATTVSKRKRKSGDLEEERAKTAAAPRKTARAGPPEAPPIRGRRKSVALPDVVASPSGASKKKAKAVKKEATREGGNGEVEGSSSKVKKDKGNARELETASSGSDVPRGRAKKASDRSIATPPTSEQKRGRGRTVPPSDEPSNSAASPSTLCRDPPPKARFSILAQAAASSITSSETPRRGRRAPAALLLRPRLPASQLHPAAGPSTSGDDGDSVARKPTTTSTSGVVASDRPTLGSEAADSLAPGAVDEDEADHEQDDLPGWAVASPSRTVPAEEIDEDKEKVEEELEEMDAASALQPPVWAAASPLPPAPDEDDDLSLEDDVGLVAAEEEEDVEFVPAERTDEDAAFAVVSAEDQGAEADELASDGPQDSHTSSLVVSRPGSPFPSPPRGEDAPKVVEALLDAPAGSLPFEDQAEMELEVDEGDEANAVVPAAYQEQDDVDEAQESDEKLAELGPSGVNASISSSSASISDIDLHPPSRSHESSGVDINAGMADATDSPPGQGQASMDLDEEELRISEHRAAVEDKDDADEGKPEPTCGPTGPGATGPACSPLEVSDQCQSRSVSSSPSLSRGPSSSPGEPPSLPTSSLLGPPSASPQMGRPCHLAAGSASPRSHSPPPVPLNVPHLPLDILSIILEHVFAEPYSSHASVVRASRRIHTISRPLLYRSVTLASVKSWTSFFSCPSMTSSTTSTSLLLRPEACRERRRRDWDRVRELSLLSPAPLSDPSFNWSLSVAIASHEVSVKRARLVSPSSTFTSAPWSGFFPRLQHLRIDLAPPSNHVPLDSLPLELLASVSPPTSAVASSITALTLTHAPSHEPIRALYKALHLSRHPETRVLVVRPAKGARRDLAQLLVEAKGIGGAERGRWIIPAWNEEEKGGDAWSEDWVDKRESWRRHGAVAVGVQ